MPLPTRPLFPKLCWQLGFKDDDYMLCLQFVLEYSYSLCTNYVLTCTYISETFRWFDGEFDDKWYWCEYEIDDSNEIMSNASMSINTGGHDRNNLMNHKSKKNVSRQWKRINYFPI